MTTRERGTRTRLNASQRRDLIHRAATEVFAKKGYRGASMAEIARRAGVTVPVVYDHFPSKRDLYRDVLEHHYQQLRSIWFDHALDGNLLDALPRAVEAWFGYVGDNRDASRLLFRDVSGDPDAAAVQQDIQLRSRTALLPLMKHALGLDAPHPSSDDAAEMAWEALRAVLQGLALWWADRPDIPRQAVVEAALGAVWVGFERAVAAAAER